MRNVLIILGGVCLSLIASAQSLQAVRSPQSKGEYCSLVKSKESFVHLLEMQESRLAFHNPGGYFNTGLCWWHSRLQRSSLYMAIYQPQKQKPSEKQVHSILDALYHERYIVAIPGYANFYDFSNDNQRAIEKYLSSSQIIDAIQGEWVSGLMGSSVVAADKLEKMMAKLEQDFHSIGQVIYQMLQMPGLVSHAWLVTDVEHQGDTYTIHHVDSNFPLENREYTYRVGDTTLLYNNGSTRFVPYTMGSDRMNQAWSLAQNFCK